MASYESAVRSPLTRSVFSLAFGLLLVTTALCPFVLASPAVASPPVQDCTNTSSGQCVKLTAQFTCVWNNGGGSYTAVFGYTNSSNSHDLTASVGSNNGFAPAPVNRGQPSFFPMGTVTNAFTVTWDGSSLTWTLPGGSDTATSGGTACLSNPVPEFSDWRAMVAAVGLLLPALAFQRRRMRRRLRLGVRYRTGVGR